MWTTMTEPLQPAPNGAWASIRQLFFGGTESPVDSYAVRAWMRTPPQKLSTDDSARKAAQLMEEDPLLHLPVFDEEGTWVGMISHRDIIRQLGRGKSPADLAEMHVADIMESDPTSVLPDVCMARAVQIMRAQHVSCLAVVSGGVLMGLLTEDEILQAVDSFLHEDLSLAA